MGHSREGMRLFNDYRHGRISGRTRPLARLGIVWRFTQRRLASRARFTGLDEIWQSFTAFFFLLDRLISEKIAAGFR
jgi:hypothetical protein